MTQVSNIKPQAFHPALTNQDHNQGHTDMQTCRQGDMQDRETGGRAGQEM